MLTTNDQRYLNKILIGSSLVQKPFIKGKHKYDGTNELV